MTISELLKGGTGTDTDNSAPWRIVSSGKAKLWIYNVIHKVRKLKLLHIVV